MNTIWGYGSLNLRNNDNTITISFASVIHKLYFNKSNLRQTAITGLLHQNNVLYRPIIQAQIALCDTTEVQNLINLVQLLNDYTSNALYIQPQYSLNNTYNNQYEVFLDSDSVDFEHISGAQLGQVLKIKFIGRALYKMPTNYSNPSTYYLVDETGYNLIDEASGNLLLTI